MWVRAATAEDSIRSSFQVPCTAWRATCTRSLFRRPGRGPEDPVSVAAAAVEASPAADLAAGAAARFRSFYSHTGGCEAPSRHQTLVGRRCVRNDDCLLCGDRRLCGNSIVLRRRETTPRSENREGNPRHRGRSDEILSALGGLRVCRGGRPRRRNLVAATGHCRGRGLVCYFVGATVSHLRVGDFKG